MCEGTNPNRPLLHKDANASTLGLICEDGDLTWVQSSFSPEHYCSWIDVVSDLFHFGNRGSVRRYKHFDGKNEAYGSTYSCCPYYGLVDSASRLEFQRDKLNPFHYSRFVMISTRRNWALLSTWMGNALYSIGQERDDEVAKTKMEQLETALDIAQTCTKMFEDANKTAADLRQSLRECLEERLIKRTRLCISHELRELCLPGLMDVFVQLDILAEHAAYGLGDEKVFLQQNHPEAFEIVLLLGSMLDQMREIMFLHLDTRESNADDAGRTIARDQRLQLLVGYGGKADPKLKSAEGTEAPKSSAGSQKSSPEPGSTNEESQRSKVLKTQLNELSRPKEVKDAFIRRARMHLKLAVFEMDMADHQNMNDAYNDDAKLTGAFCTCSLTQQNSLHVFSLGQIRRGCKKQRNY